MQPRRAFTLVEVLVALVLMGAGAAALVTAVTGDHRLRERSAQNSFAAAAARARLEVLATLPCSGDLSGAVSSARGVEHWHATASAPVWRFTDSVTLQQAPVPIVIAARVACAG